MAFAAPAPARPPRLHMCISPSARTFAHPPDDRLLPRARRIYAPIGLIYISTPASRTSSTCTRRRTGLSHRRLLNADACHRAVPFPHPVPMSAPPVPWPEPMPEPFSRRNARAHACRKPLSPLSPVAWPVSLLCSVLCPLALLCAPLCVHPLSLLSSLSPSFSPIPSLRGSSLLSARHACPSRVVCAFCASRVFALVAHVQ